MSVRRTAAPLCGILLRSKDLIQRALMRPQAFGWAHPQRVFDETHVHSRRRGDCTPNLTNCESEGLTVSLRNK